MRVSRLWLLASLVSLGAACGGTTEPPASPPPASVASIAPAASPPATAAAPPSTASAAPVASSAPAPPPSDDKEAKRAAWLASNFERALNAGATMSAQDMSSPACWAKECGSVSKQAQKKFKVKLSGDVQMSGTRGAIPMDVICEGTRPCDKVILLLENDCVGKRWLVYDVTEKEAARTAWLGAAPAACPP